MDKLEELIRLCWNAGWDAGDGTSFSDWWEEYGEDRYKTFIQEGDPEMLETLKGLLQTLNTVIETANTKGSDFVAGGNMRWGMKATELIAKLDV